MPNKKTATSAPAKTTAPSRDTPALPPAAQIVLALLGKDGTTAAELSDRAGLGRSTVTKALASLLDQGLALREQGGHEGARRIADRWFAAPAAAPPRAAAGDGRAEAQLDAEASDGEAVAVDSAPVGGEQAAERADAGAGGEGAADEPTGDVEANTDEAPAAEAEHVSSNTANDQSADEVGAADESVPAQAVSGEEHAAQRLGKGELRAMVEAHLRGNPDREWTPTAISKVLGKSAGAINNACVKLVESGDVATFPDKPGRFQWNGDQNAA